MSAKPFVIFGMVLLAACETPPTFADRCAARGLNPASQAFMQCERNLSDMEYQRKMAVISAFQAQQHRSIYPNLDQTTTCQQRGNRVICQ